MSYVKGYENQIKYVTNGQVVFDNEGNVTNPILPQIEEHPKNIYDEVKIANKKWIRQQELRGEQIWQRN